MDNDEKIRQNLDKLEQNGFIRNFSKYSTTLKEVGQSTSPKHLTFRGFARGVFNELSKALGNDVAHRGTIFAVVTCPQRTIINSTKEQRADYIIRLKQFRYPEFLQRYNLPDWVCDSLSSTTQPVVESRQARSLADGTEAFRRQALDELREKCGQAALRGTQDTLTRELLEKAKQPNTDQSRGAVEAFFYTGDEAANLVDSGSWDAPIFTNDQQPFQWKKGSRPIAQLFSRMGPLYGNMSVQKPSGGSTGELSEVWELRRVREQFMEGGDTDEPLAIETPRIPLPHVLPVFLTGENCQLLHQARNHLLEVEGASAQEWNEWQTEWAVITKGGSNTGPRTNSLAKWMTEQEGPTGLGWMSLPTKKEREGWLAHPHAFTAGQWRYVVLWPGSSALLPPGTIYFLFRCRAYQTLALCGNILRWDDVAKWIEVVNALIRHPAPTSKGTKPSAKLVHAVAKLVKGKMAEGREPWGLATRFFASIEVWSSSYVGTRMLITLGIRGIKPMHRDPF